MALSYRIQIFHANSVFIYRTLSLSFLTTVANYLGKWLRSGTTNEGKIFYLFIFLGFRNDHGSLVEKFQFLEFIYLTMLCREL